MRLIFTTRTAAVSAAVSTLLLAGCGGGDSDRASRNIFDGYMPRFSGEYLNGDPTAASPANASPVAFSAQATGENPQQTGEFEDPLAGQDILEIDCTETLDLTNNAPQLLVENNVQQSALDFVRGLQAQVIFYDCVTRQQVFGQPARVSNVEVGADEEPTTLVEAGFEVDGNTYYASWTMPTSVTREDAATELRINARGTLLNLQPGIDTSKTRVELVQASVGNVFRKEISATLQDSNPGTGLPNIRAVTLVEKRDQNNDLIEQMISGRIVYNDSIRVISAIIDETNGAYIYMRTCESSASDATDTSHTRDCTAAEADSTDTAQYDNQWVAIPAQNLTVHLTDLGAGAGGTIPAGEHEFYGGESEASFFEARTLPPESELDGLVSDLGGGDGGTQVEEPGGE